MSGIFDPPKPVGLGSLRGLPAPQKRRVFFSFHFNDIMRVNNVRQAWKIDHPDAPIMRSFYDSSLWERRQIEGPDAVKRLIRGGVNCTSAVCVLVGTETWSRRWVRYEIARSVIDERGLLAVHLNGIKHHSTGQRHPLGQNPLAYMGVGKVQLTLAPQYYLFEHTPDGWMRYKDYTDPVALPKYLPDPPADCVTPLSAGSGLYDYSTQHGHIMIGRWIDHAAQRVGQ
jgi:MTH538 TIR-like domain (DUF1863)